MRRQKCDREHPCGRCVKRGQADKCTTDWGPTGYDPKKHRVYPRTEGKTSYTDAPRHHESELLNGVGDAAFDFAEPSASVTTASQSILTPPFQMGIHEPTPQPGVIDFPGYGKVRLGEYDPRLKSVQILGDAQLQNGMRENGEESMLSDSFGGTGPAQVAFMQLLLPSQRQIFQLVEYQIDQVLWYHNCFHAPTFHAELSAATTGAPGLQIKNTDLQWTALLFSIMASSMFSVSDAQALRWGFQKEERSKLTRQWFKSCMTCLNLSDYMRCHHLYSIQAINILTQSGHVLGYSNTHATLLGAAFKIAQSLGLQRLGLDDDELSLTARTGMLMVPAQRQKIIQRETGRRVWAALCIQDWFSIAFSEMYSINPMHFQTLKPINLDDTTLQTYLDDVPTQSSFTNYLYEIAKLMPAGHDAILASNTLYTKYERVLEFDAKLRQLVTEQCPKYLNVMEPIEPGWPAWIPWARRSVMLCYHHKIIMIHRPFLARSFTEPTFAASRRACLSASKNILKEAKQAYDEEGPSLWIDQAFMVAAGITLALDAFHRRKGEPELDEHKKLVETTITMLSKYDSMIGTRGCRMLASLLAEQSAVCANIQLARRKHGLEGAESSEFKRQKFDVPSFVEKFVGNNSSFTSNLGMQMQSSDNVDEGQQDLVGLTGQSDGIVEDNPFAYEKFEQLFPPQSGISNSFLFEDLLNFNI